jgi:hypothetical protein
MKIAIRGHKSRGKEVIQILESLGGKNNCPLTGADEGSYYYIDIMDNKGIRCHDFDYANSCKKYTLEEFEKEFPFKIGNKVTIAGLPDFPKTITKIEWDCDEILYSFEGLVNTWFGAKALKKFEMKEERNITLTLDKAKEWYKKGGELKEIALQAFSEKELNPLPRSWEEFCEKYPVKNGGCWVGSQDIIYSATFITQDRKYKTRIPSKKSAEAHLAMIQLEQLRDCWRQGWKPIEYDTGYCITHYPEKYLIVPFNFITFLSFPTKEMAKEFLECFRDLIEKARDLI